MKDTYRKGRDRLKVSGLSFGYPRGRRKALLDVSFELRAGELAVVSGSNGAGKSTLALALNGTIPHLISGEFSGCIELGGAPIGVPRELAADVGVIFQDFEAHLVASSVSLEVAFPLENLGVPAGEQRTRVAKQLQTVGLKGFDERFPAELSGGEKQRLAVAAALAPEPGLLVLDEPLTDLDPAGKELLLGIIMRLRSNGVTVLIIEHDPKVLLSADRLLVLQEGRLIYNAEPDALISDTRACEEMGIPVWPPAQVASALGVGGPPHDIDSIAARLRPRLPPVVPPRSILTPTLGGNLVEIRKLSSGYPAGAQVLHEVDFEVKRGECVALLGQNGSGKTALAKHAVGLIAPRRGEILVDGRKISEYTMGDLSRIVGYVFQNPDHQIFSDTVFEEVAFGVRNLGLAGSEIEARTREALSAVGLAEYKQADPFSLAKGERQRLAVASLLAYRPQAVFFDEPTTGLDASESRRMMDFIRSLNRQGLTVILITHAMWAAAECAHRVVVMSEGRVVLEGPVAEVFSREEVLAQLALSPPPAASLANRLGVPALSVPDLLAAFEEPKCG